jgi:hypothetical protein
MSAQPPQIQLVRLAIQDVGVLDGRLDLGPFERGLTVISARSPLARAALVAALDAALFERHDAVHEGILALRARGTGKAPEIRLELCVGGERMSVHKRFLERPFAEVRLPREGAVFTGAKAEEVVSALLGSRAPGRARGERADGGLLAGGLEFIAQRRDLSARLAATDDELPALEREWKRAEGAQAQARDVATLADESEIELARAEVRFGRIHGEMTARAALIGELAEAGAPTSLDEARRDRLRDTLVALQAITSDALLEQRHATALAALGPAHRQARAAAVALEAAAPQLLHGESARALGAITACKRRSRALRALLTDLSRTWSLPLVLEDSPERPREGSILSMLQDLRDGSSELRILVLTAPPSRFDRAHIDHLVDLDELRDERRRAPDLDRLSG